MMDNDQLFDEMVRMKLAQRSFGPSDAGWENMKHLLPPERKRRTIGLRTAILACMLTAFAGGGVVFLLLRDPQGGANENHVTAAVAVPESSGSAIRSDAATENDAAFAVQPAHEELPHDANRNATQHSPSEKENIHGTPGKQAFRNEEQPANIQHALVAPIMHDERLIAGPAATHNASPSEAEEKQHGSNAQQFFRFDSVMLPALATLPSPEGIDSVALSAQWSPDANYWMLQGGVAYTGGLSRADLQASAFSPVAGIGYNVWLNPAWSVQAGLRYSSIGNLSGARAITASTSPDGTIAYNESQLHRVHALSLPVQAWRRVGNRHAFGAGYTLNFLLAARQRNYSYTDLNGVISNESSNRSFTRSGFSRFDGLLTAGYAFTLSNHLQLEACAYSGLTDILHNSSYGNRFERNKGVMLLVNYSF